MKFYIPHAKDIGQQNRVYDSIKTFVASQSGGEISDLKVQSLSYVHNGKDCFAEVGKPDPLIGEEVIAILYQDSADLYHVCTPNRGVARGMSILVGGREVDHVQYFDESST